MLPVDTTNILYIKRAFWAKIFLREGNYHINPFIQVEATIRESPPAF
jgi:hypothetical protein